MRHARACMQEAKLGQKFLVDATLFCDLRRAGGSDDLAHTINYAEVYECVRPSPRPCPAACAPGGCWGGGGGSLPSTASSAAAWLAGGCRCIKHIMEGPPHKLLESAAERISRSILAADERIAGVQLQLRKPHVAVTGVLESLGAPRPGPALRLGPGRCSRALGSKGESRQRSAGPQPAQRLAGSRGKTHALCSAAADPAACRH